jgi:hypothetical protein
LKLLDKVEAGERCWIYVESIVSDVIVDFASRGSKKGVLKKLNYQ